MAFSAWPSFSELEPEPLAARRACSSTAVAAPARRRTRKPPFGPRKKRAVLGRGKNGSAQIDDDEDDTPLELLLGLDREAVESDEDRPLMLLHSVSQDGHPDDGGDRAAAELLEGFSHLESFTVSSEHSSSTAVPEAGLADSDHADVCLPLALGAVSAAPQQQAETAVDDGSTLLLLEQWLAKEQLSESPAPSAASSAPRGVREFWTPDGTDRFYAALFNYGCDWGKLAAAFPLHSKRQLYAKFRCERARRPGRVKEAVTQQGRRRAMARLADIEELLEEQSAWVASGRVVDWSGHVVPGMDIACLCAELVRLRRLTGPLEPDVA